MMRAWHGVLAALLWLSWGCGDDETSGGSMDGGTDASMSDAGGGSDGGDGDASMGGRCDRFRMNAPDPDSIQEAPCCYRKRNDADPANAELRLTSLQLTQPASLANPLVATLLARAFQQETFNWLIALDGANGDGMATVKTGYGIRMAGGTYRFAMDEAPAPGEAGRWNPISATADFSGEQFSTAPLTEVLTVPVLDTTGMNVRLELPLLGFELQQVTLTEDRSCVGAYNAGSWDVGSARVRAFVRVEDAKAGEVDLGGRSTSLCNVLRGALTAMDNCETDQADWGTKPDALCDAAGSCQADPGDGSVCDPASSCNAWLLVGGAAAHGVEIENHPSSG